jgi:hypothetical protein
MIIIVKSNYYERFAYTLGNTLRRGLVANTTMRKKGGCWIVVLFSLAAVKENKEWL